MNTKTRNERDDFAQSHSSLRRIQSAVVRGLCGGIADMTLYRWLADPEKGFPKPIYIGRRRFWVEAEIFA